MSIIPKDICILVLLLLVGVIIILANLDLDP
jgi:hypothetical protein